MLTSGKVPFEKTLNDTGSQFHTPNKSTNAKGDGRWQMADGTYINRQVLPQAPSPTMTSLRRISAILAGRVSN